MLRLVRPLAILSLAVLAGCGTTQRLAAAQDVHALLVSIRDNDRQTFEAHIDRRALTDQLQGRLEREVAGARAPDEWRAVGALLAGPIAQVAGEALIRPEVFRSAAEAYGYGPDKKIPNVFAIASVLKPLPDGKVCATRRKNGPCLLTFADQEGTWRLVRYDGDPRDLRLRR